MIPETNEMEPKVIEVEVHTVFINLNSAKALINTDVKDFKPSDLWTFFIKYRHVEEMRDKIEEIKKLDENIRRIDDELLEKEKDKEFMKKMAELIEEERKAGYM